MKIGCGPITKNLIGIFRRGIPAKTGLVGMLVNLKTKIIVSEMAQLFCKTLKVCYSFSINKGWNHQITHS
jgi:hypothetical protein